MTTKNCANCPKLVLKDLCKKSFVRNVRLPFELDFWSAKMLGAHLFPVFSFYWVWIWWSPSRSYRGKKPSSLSKIINVLEIWIIKLCYFVYRWLSIREKSIQCAIWRWKALLWRRMVCGSVTDIYLLICDSCAHMAVTIKTKLHTLSGICE